MRYTYNSETNVLKLVKYIRFEGNTISNPPDELVDELKAGYPLESDPKPSYDPEKEDIFPEYAFSDGVIHETWKVVQLEPENPEDDEATVWDELDKAYEEGVNAV